MATRALRTVHAAVALAGLLGVLLVAWFLAGWADVRAQQRDVRATPVRETQTQAIEIAHELRGELTRLVVRETERPYYHYQNLFHDPRSGTSWTVAPSPLADKPTDPLVLGYFQLDDEARLTTPTLNDEVPDLVNKQDAGAYRAFRSAVQQGFGDALAQLVAKGPLVASASQLSLDASSYVQNSISSRVFVEQRSTPTNVVPTPSLPVRKDKVTITISPLEWHTYTFLGAPALVAVRHVATPDGNLAQGFVVAREGVTSWLASRVADRAQLVASDDAHAAEVVPGWHLALTPSSEALATAATSADAIARRFGMRFALVGMLALVAAAFVIVVVARAERLASERSQFAAAAAHELRTPLAGLQLYGDMLADGLGDPQKLRDYARRMSEEAARLGRVVSNVLGFSQLERGNLAVDAKPGDLGVVLAELAERVQPSLDRAGAVLALDVSPDLRACFDRDALARIVGNLLDNAEKYSRNAEDRTIDLVARDAGAHAEVIVTDRGPGITEAQREKLFKPFSRGVDGDGPAGLGLGLALSRSLAEAMGGKLVVRPSTERGATFVLQLPKAQTT